MRSSALFRSLIYSGLIVALMMASSSAWARHGGGGGGGHNFDGRGFGTGFGGRFAAGSYHHYGGYYGGYGGGYSSGSDIGFWIFSAIILAIYGISRIAAVLAKRRTLVAITLVLDQGEGTPPACSARSRARILTTRSAATRRRMRCSRASRIRIS